MRAHDAVSCLAVHRRMSCAAVYLPACRSAIAQSATENCQNSKLACSLSSSEAFGIVVSTMASNLGMTCELSHASILA